MPFDPSSLPGATLEKLLSAGTFVLVDEDRDGGLRSTVSAALVDASPAKVREVLTDFESYAKWLPQLTRSKVIAEKGTTTDVEFTLSFRFSVFSKSLDYGLRYKAKGDDRIEWDRLSGDFTENRGSWSWVPIERGKRTAVFYEFYVDIASGLGSMVRMALKASPQMEVAIATSTAVLIARAVKTRVESL